MIYYLLKDVYLLIIIKWVVGKDVTLMMIMSKISIYALNTFGKWRVMISRMKFFMTHRLWVSVTNLPLECDFNSGVHLQRVFLRDHYSDIGKNNMGGK